MREREEMMMVRMDPLQGGDDGAGKEKDGGAVKREAPDAERDNVSHTLLLSHINYSIFSPG